MYSLQAVLQHASHMVERRLSPLRNFFSVPSQGSEEEEEEDVEQVATRVRRSGLGSKEASVRAVEGRGGEGAGGAGGPQAAAAGNATLDRIAKMSNDELVQFIQQMDAPGAPMEPVAQVLADFGVEGCDLVEALAGGVSGVLAQAALARSSGTEGYLASMLDGPLGSAAALHAAAALRLTIPSGLATLDRFDGLDGGRLAPSDGAITVPLGPGLGVGPAEA